jgi:hypothetical protein
MAGDRRVHIGGDAIGNAIVLGDGNDVKVTQRAPVEPASVDVGKELAAIRAILMTLGAEHAGKIGRALDDAAEEAGKPGGGDKTELGDALDRALRLAKSTSAFAGAVGKLMPHVHNAVAWLGDTWAKLLTHLT